MPRNGSLRSDIREIYLLLKQMQYNPASGLSKRSKSGLLSNIKNKSGKLVMIILIFAYLGFIGWTQGRLMNYTPEASIASFRYAILFTFMGTVFTVFSFMFTSNDTDLYLTLPLKVSNIARAKSLFGYLPSYMLSFFALSVLFGGLFHTQASIIEYVLSALTILLLPLFVGSIFSLLAVLSLRIIPVKNKKKLSHYLQILLVIITILGIMVMSLRTSIDSARQPITTVSELVELSGKSYLFILGFPAFCYFQMASGGFAPTSIAMWGSIALIATIALTVVSQFVLGNIFFSVYNSFQNGDSNRKKLKLSYDQSGMLPRELHKQIKKRSILKSLMQADFDTIKNETMLLIDALMPSLILPLILLGSSGYGLYVALTEGGQRFGDLFSGIRKSTATLTFDSPYFIPVFAIGSMVIAGICAFNSISSQLCMSSFTRDNLRINLIKRLPISLNTYWFSKFWLCELLLNGVVFSLLVLICLIIGLKWYLLLYLIVVYIAFSSMSVAATLFADIINPLLNWSSYQQLKMRFGVFFRALILLSIPLALSQIPCYYLYRSAEISSQTMFTIFSVLNLVISVGFFTAYKILAIKKLEKTCA